ncbi:MAG: hypothetical protein QXT43_02765 [Candidatus Micrarchaeaceae archaeon]
MNNASAAIIASVFLLALPLLQGTAYASIGTSSILLNESNVTVLPGGSARVSYTVSLATGSTWGTSISVVNASALSASGISTSLSNTYGDPTYSGVLAISTSSSTHQGTYQISMQASGDDPSPVETLTLVVLAPPTSSTSTVAPVKSNVTTSSTANTTSASTSVQTTAVPLTTTQPSPTAPSYSATALYMAILEIVILFAVIALALKYA